MNNPTSQPTDPLHALRGRLEVVLLIADDLIYSEGAATSRYFNRWCEIKRTAGAFASLCEEPWFSDLETLIGNWLSVTIDELEGFYTPGDDAS